MRQRWWRRYLRDERGNFALLFALLLPAIVGAMALAVDEAALYHDKRLLQSGVDMAAIYAMGDLTAARARASRVLADARLPSGVENPSLVVQTGVYTANPNVQPAQRLWRAPTQQTRCGCR